MNEAESPADDTQEQGDPQPSDTLIAQNGDMVQEQMPTARKGWDPIPFLLGAYFGAAAMFCLSFNIWVMPWLPYPLIANTLQDQYIRIPESARREGYINPTVFLLFMWGFHFTRRFGEVMYVHIFSRRMPPFHCIGAIIYYSFFGFWVGWSLNIHCGYFPPKSAIFAPGVLIFIFGEVGNFASHFALRQLRSKKPSLKHTIEVTEETNEMTMTTSRHVIPDGRLFKLVSCPNYSFEVITWIGFFIASFTLASFVFLLASATSVFVLAYKHHRAYKKEFDGKDGRPLYPERRKAIIPFIF